MDIPASPRRTGGVTLVDLLIALALAGILLASALPNLRELWLNNRMTTAINLLVSSLHSARSVAIMRRERGVICPSQDGEHCANVTNWQSGWILFVDSNASQQREDGEELLQVQSALPTDLHIHSGVGRKLVSYQIDGSAPGSNNTLAFCDDRGPDKARAVIISNTGRPRVSSTLAASVAARCTEN